MARPGRRLILRLSLGVLGLLLMAVLVVGLWLWRGKAGFLQPRIQATLGQSLNQDVQLGALSWTWGDTLQVISQDGQIAARGAAASPWLKWRRLEMHLPAGLLLQRRAQIEQIEIEGLRLQLHRDREGRSNVILPEQQVGEGDGIAVSLRQMKLIDAHLSITDEARDVHYSLEHSNLSLVMPQGSEAKPLRLEAVEISGLLKGNRVPSSGLTIRAAIPALTWAQAQSQVQWQQAQLEVADDRLLTTGEVTLQPDLNAKGELTLQVPNLRASLAQIAISLPPMQDPQALSGLTLETRFQTKAKQAQFDGFKLKFDDTQSVGSLTLQNLEPFAGRFDLQADQIQLHRYLRPEDQPGTPLELPVRWMKQLQLKGQLKIADARFGKTRAEAVEIKVE